MKRLILLTITLTIFVSPAYSALDYDKSIDAIKNYIKNREFPYAEEMLKAMLRQYPDNEELLSILARVLFWQKKYDESIAVYQRILRFKDDDPLKKELERVEAAKIISEADLMIREGKTREAEIILTTLFDSAKEQYDSGYRLGMLYIKEREYKKAIDIFHKLKTIFPEDRGFIALYTESLISNGDIEKAKKDLYAFPEDIKDYLYREREDIFYRVRRNSVKLSGSFFSYTKGFNNESDISFEVSQRIRDLTFVFNTSRIHRFGLHDYQTGLDIYSKLGEKTKRWGYISFSISPDAEFLPKTQFGGEIYQGYKAYEFSLGYRRMNFKDKSVDILIPGIIMYLPYGFSLNERMYILPENGSLSLLSTLNYEPDHRFRGFYSIAVGKSSEEITSLQDIRKITTVSNRVGIEYKFKAFFSIGAELAHEQRQNLYNKSGITLFTRYWW